ncbi:MAG: hypothetical protein KGI08_09075 [Thaumarchaeota archaeon]|nr:hypothetical protein [Nitrososphaerota archaeon]
MNRDQEKAMFAKNKTGPGIRKKQIDNQKPKLRLKKFNPGFKGYDPKDDEFNHYHRKLESDYFEYNEIQKRTKLPKLNLDEYKIAYGYWDKLPEDKRRNVLSTVTGKSPEKIKFVNYKFNDLSHREQNACLILGKGHNYMSSV